ncbi:LysR substrate-binding domain-containing protein [Amycolatopsis sp. lyj-346]|uniref:LysR substrate-binding domain-containing protein n=1 Tax=Amycolatopsis sp. lyj-346 TaxID=2789289 RepID=UPI00397AFEA2
MTGRPEVDRQVVRLPRHDGGPFVAVAVAGLQPARQDDVLVQRAGREGEPLRMDLTVHAGLVAAGLGVSAVPGLVLPLMTFAGLRHRPLGHPRTERTIAVVRVPHRPLAPAATAFRAAITQASRYGIPLPAETNWL